MATQYGIDYARTARANRLPGWANLVLGVWLFISPWVLRFGYGMAVGAAGAGGGATVAGTAVWNAWVLGGLTFVVALSAISSLEPWQEWITLLFGAWIFVAPWALGFTRLGAASWDHWLIGAAIFLISAAALSRHRGEPVATPTTTTSTGLPTDEARPPVDRMPPP